MGRTRRLLQFLPQTETGDRLWSILYHVAKTGRPPRLTRPRSYTDHNFARRLSEEMNSPLRRLISDKHCMKRFVAERAGVQYVVPTLAVLRTPEEIREFEFPDECVIKPTHMSGQIIVRRSGSEPVDRQRLCRWLKIDYSKRLRERNYRDLCGRVIVEPFVFGAAVSPSDFKVHCFGGEPKFIGVDLNRFQVHATRLYTPSWLPLNMRYGRLALGSTVPRPPNLAALLDVCRKVAGGFDYIRADVYVHGTSIKIGELTNLPAGGLCIPVYRPMAADLAAGEFFRDPSADPACVFRDLVVDESGLCPEHSSPRTVASKHPERSGYVLAGAPQT